MRLTTNQRAYLRVAMNRLAKDAADKVGPAYVVPFVSTMIWCQLGAALRGFARWVRETQTDEAYQAHPLTAQIERVVRTQIDRLAKRYGR